MQNGLQRLADLALLIPRSCNDGNAREGRLHPILELQGRNGKIADREIDQSNYDPYKGYRRENQQGVMQHSACRCAVW